MFIIKGNYNDESVYYLNSYIDKNTGYIIRQFSKTFDGAKIYTSNAQAKKILSKLKNNSFAVFPICPICRKIYLEVPAISRKDNVTMICSNCGLFEALNDFKNLSQSNKKGM